MAIFVGVWKFRAFDTRSGQWALQERLAIWPTIYAMRGLRIEGTLRMVPSNQIDEDGFYIGARGGGTLNSGPSQLRLVSADPV